MAFWEILLVSVALAMDACAVAMTNGMTATKMPLRRQCTVGLFFGFFQFLMLLIGYFITGVLADAFLETFQSISAWISFALLAFLGGKMIIEAIKEMRECRFRDDGECVCQTRLTLGKLTVQAIATSIDALAVGVTLQMASISAHGLALGAWGATLTIGIVTFVLSFLAVSIGKLMGDKLANKAGLFGGLVLVGIGLKILLESLL